MERPATLLMVLSALFFGEITSQSVCPNRCLCYLGQQPRSVMCSRQGLEEFPTNISDVVEHLDLSSNLLTEIADDIVRLTELQYLNLAKNQLNHLPKDLSSLKYLRRLDLSDNDIDNIANIASISNLASLVVLYLSKNPLSELDGLTNSVLQAVDASHCAIKELGNRSLEGLPSLSTLSLLGNPLQKIQNPFGQKLRWLDMSDCLLNYLTPETLNGFPELEELRLANNPKLVYSTRYSTLKHIKLKRLDVSRCNLDRPGLHGFPLLTYARLSRNMIRFLPDRIFAKNKLLTHLFLNSNGLEQLNTSTFEGLVKLQILDLSANSLEQINLQTFQENIDLRLLNLSYNAFIRFPNLSSMVSSLDLSSNLINSIEKGSLSSMPRIVNLNLNDNRLQSLPNGIRSTTLKVLSLRRNRIVHLQNDCFVQLPEIQKIDLSGNRLTEAMAPEIFRNNPNILTIHLEDNPWRCDCQQLFVTFNFLTNSPAKTPGSTLICQSPGNVSGYSWESACFEAWHGYAYYDKDRTWGLVLISMLTLVILCGSVVSIRHTMKMKRRALERRHELEVAEGRERLRLLQRRSQRLEEELMERPPEPRINPLELVGPPTYEEAVQMPRLARSLDALDSISMENVSVRTLGSVDNLRAKKRRTRRPRKRVLSEDDLMKREERREIRRRRERRNSSGNICDSEHSQPASQTRSSRVSSARRGRRQSVLEEQESGSSSKGRPRPQTPSARKKKRRQIIGDGHVTDDEDSDVRNVGGSDRSIVIVELRREPRSGYRERPTDPDVQT